jgi:hypothetical protein
MNTIGDMENTEGYYVNLTSTESLSTDGTVLAYPYNIPLISGWNIMSYPVGDAQAAMDVLQPLINDGYLVKVLSESGGVIQFITGVGWLNTIGNFNPTEGYYINVNTDCTLPVNEPTKATAPAGHPEPDIPTVFFTKSGTNPFSPMNIIVRDILTDGFKIEEGDELAVFDGELQVGSMVISDENGAYFGIIARTDDPVTDHTDGFIPGNEISFKYWDKSEDVVYSNIDAIYQSGDKNYNPLGTYVGELEISSLGEVEHGLKDNTYLGQNFPNPYNDKTRIEYGIAEDAFVSISVHDVSGRTIMVLKNAKMAAGKYQLELSKSSLDAGIYYYRMSVSGAETSFSATRKMILY